jgi:hypothetical protein
LRFLFLIFLCHIAPCFALLLFNMVHFFTPCIVVAYCGVSPLPCGATVVCCDSSSFTLRYYCLLWCVIPCFALLLLVMVHRLHLVVCIVVAIYCGLLSLTLHCCYLLWFVVPHLALLFVCCVVLCLVLLLLVMVCCFHLALLLLAMVHHMVPCTCSRA